MKATIAIIIAFALASCAGYTFSVQSPYGDLQSAKDGSVVIIPKPIIVPSVK